VAGAEVARRKPPEHLAAYDYVLRGLEQLNMAGEEHNAEARRLFEKAVEADPSYAAGYAYLALTIYVQWQNDRTRGELALSVETARKALALDENDSRVHRILSFIYTNLRQHDRADFHAERAVALNPNDAHATLALAVRLRDAGRAEEAVACVRKAMQLNPYHPNWYWNTFGRVLHDAGRYAEALEAYARIDNRTSFHDAYVAAAYAELGQMEEAKKHATLALERRPDFSVSKWAERLTYKHDADRQRFLASLRKADLPE
jgi:adenylate cyclase